tara:strand:+ start:59 stop:487 length:429 start_codon:yes stop_codon:yes gene_type:complete
MSITDYTVDAEPEQRMRNFEEINSLFDVNQDEVRDAADAAGVNTYLEGMTYYFFANCIREGRNLRSTIEDDEDIGALYDDLHEYADACVPHQSYIAMQIWVDTGYETQSAIEFDIGLEDIVRCAQVQLYQFAQDVIISVVEG